MFKINRREGWGMTGKKKRRVRITVESDQVYVMRRPGRNLRALCAECGDMVHMIMPEEAMALAGVSSREIYRLVEAGRVHFLETADGYLLICLDSLPLSGITGDMA